MKTALSPASGRTPTLGLFPGRRHCLWRWSFPLLGTLEHCLRAEGGGAGKEGRLTKTLLDQMPFFRFFPTLLGSLSVKAIFQIRRKITFTFTMFPSNSQTGHCREELVPRTGAGPSHKLKETDSSTLHGHLS